MSRRKPGLRTAHGNSRECGRLTASEVVPWDEMPAGEPGPAREASPNDRGEGGRFARGNTTASEGGRARAGQTRLASQLGLAPLASDPAFEPYKRSGEAFRRAQCASIAASVGGGTCGPGPSSIIASAALALAASRYLYDHAGGDADLMTKAARLADSSRASLRDAHALAALEAQARPKANRIEALRASLKGPTS